MKERGIIITPPIRITKDGGLYIESSEITPQQLRLSLLFWDKIDWPDNNMISIGGETADLEFLSECGIFNRTKVHLSGSFNQTTAMLQMQDAVLKEKNRLEPGMWSIERIGEELVPMSGLTNQKSIQFELYDSIPVPHKDVPFHDILDFKEKYRSELIALRCLLDEMYLTIIQSPEPILAKHIALIRLTNAISDVHKAMESKSILRSLTDIKIVLNDFNDFSDTVTRGYGAYELAKVGLNDSLTAGLVGVANAMFKISVKENPISKGLPKELKDYAYIAKIKQEFL